MNPYQTLSDYNGIHLTIKLAEVIHEETAYWVYFFTPSDKINMLHVNTFKRASSLDFDVLLRLTNEDVKAQIKKRKKKIEEKERQEIQEEEAIVRSLMLENG